MLVALSMVAVLIMALRTRNAAGPVRAALIGIILLLGFIAVRAASFHHVDVLLMDRIGGWRLNWLFELTGIALVAVPAARAASGGKPAARRRR